MKIARIAALTITRDALADEVQSLLERQVSDAACVEKKSEFIAKLRDRHAVACVDGDPDTATDLLEAVRQAQAEIDACKAAAPVLARRLDEAREGVAHSERELAAEAERVARAAFLKEYAALAGDVRERFRDTYASRFAQLRELRAAAVEAERAARAANGTKALLLEWQVVRDLRLQHAADMAAMSAIEQLALAGRVGEDAQPTQAAEPMAVFRDSALKFGEAIPAVAADASGAERVAALDAWKTQEERRHA